MTNRLALILFALIILLILLDTLVFDSGVTMETLRKGRTLLQSLAFWR